MAQSNTHITSQTIDPSQLGNFISTILHPHLPHSVPLYRRCQYELAHPSNATIWHATDLSISSHPWLAAFIDLTNPGQTQIWLYASWERDSTQATSSQALFAHLFNHLRNDHIPNLPVDPPQSFRLLASSGKILSRPYSRTKVLFGSLHRVHHGIVGGKTLGRITRLDDSYLKYLIPLAGGTGMPAVGLRLGSLREADLQVVVDRSPIPRTVDTIRPLQNVAVFDGERPVSWGLLSKDGSVASLFTESEYRRRGLSRIVARGLIELAGDGPESSGKWCHADVSESNIASRGVIESVGGKVGWTVAWVEVDLGE